MKKILLKQKRGAGLLFFCFFIFSYSFSQQNLIVTGTVLNELNQPLAGVSVAVKGSGIGITSNDKGKFSIRINAGGILVFSFVGYERKEVRVYDARRPLIVQLISQNTTLGDVVVVGYGTSRKSDLTGSVSSIPKKLIEKVPTATFDLKLQGRIAGVSVSQTSAEPNGAVSIRIRGSNSISAGNEPLYVVDGYPLPEGGEAAGNGYGQSSNPLSGLNPNDIESIEVLKDASATAIYGSRGANGVVIITTKKGSEGAPQVTFDSRMGVSKISRIINMMNARDYAQIRNDYALSQGLAIPYDGSSPKNPTPEQAGVGTDWLREILRTGISQSYQLGISGGSKQFRYNISGNLYQENGIVKNSDFTRGNLRINLNNRISDKFNIATNINLSNSNYKRTQPGTGAVLNVTDAISLALRSNPIFPTDATLTGVYGGVTNTEDGGLFNNPLILLSDKKDVTQNQDYFATILGTYKIIKGLDLNLRGGSSRRNSTRQIYYPVTTSQGYLTNGDAYSNSFIYKDYIFESFLKYQNAFNKNNKIDLTGGFSYQSNTSMGTNIRVSAFPNDILGYDGLQFGTAYYPTSTTKILRTLQSYYLRANYSLLDRYLFTFTGRADGSSVFAKNNKWGYFPSGAVAWKLSQEPFFPKNDIVTNVKLRASYGITGNQAIPPMGSLARLGIANYDINNQLASGIAPISMSNPDLKWESTKEVDFGGDFSFLNGKLNLTIDAYKKTTDDLLQTLQLPVSSGFSTALANIGSIENKGLEFEISADAISTKDFSWTPSFNISFNKSKILNLGTKDFLLGPAPGTNYLSSPSNILKVGEPYAAFYGLKALRLIQASDFDANGKPTFATLNGNKDLGQWLYEDVDHNNIINDADRQIIGDPNPDFIFGFNNDFSYKNFHLSVFIQGVYGNQIMNFNNAFIRTGYTPTNKSQEWFDNRWTEKNPTNDIRYPAIGTLQSSLVSGNYYVEDGSFVRLKNVTFTYDIPHIGKTLKSASVYISGTNLVTLTNYSGFDPEVGIYGQANLIPGIDLGAYPRSKMVDLGLKLNF
jgi:TonB-linked SusC/RagA family outer membrane protein